MYYRFYRWTYQWLQITLFTTLNFYRTKSILFSLALFVSMFAFSQVNKSTDADNNATFTFIEWTPYLWYGYIFEVQNNTATTMSFTITNPSSVISGTVEQFSYLCFRTNDGYIAYQENIHLTLQYSAGTAQRRLKVKTTGSPY